ncbi:MAG: right-handed parallel beta-helix repeat-containing protein [Lentisphaeria bacterium]|nr:right-handed parallel beta-helix repeat-containing protein [Lentisphaeria bacterium]
MCTGRFAQAMRGLRLLRVRGVFGVPALVAWAAAVAGAAPLALHVSPDGDDAQSGTFEGPFRTLPRAMQAVRELRVAQTRPQPIAVFLRGGRYALAEPIVFRPEDTGTPSSAITYSSWPGERAVLSGGRLLPGPWEPVPGRPYWRTRVPALDDGGPWRFHSLYVNGESRQRARHPNWGEKVFRAVGRAPGEDERQAFVYRAGDIDPGWTNLHDADLVLLCSWTPTLHRIREIAPERCVVRFGSTHARSVDFWEQAFRYYVVNVFEALDAPGEWYLDARTSMLTYYPLPGEDLAAAEVIAPRLSSRLVTFRGGMGERGCIGHLTFRDLDFRHVDGDLDRYDGMYRQGHMFLDAAVYAEGLRSSTFEGCTFAQLGEYAMELGPGCQDNRIERCHIWDIGGGAMQIGLTHLGALLAARVQPLPGDVELQAEEGTVRGALVVAPDAEAGGGAYVVLPAGAEGSGETELSVAVDTAGEYVFYARVLAPSGSSDSFTVQVNDGPTVTYDTGVGASWFLAPVVGRELDGKPLVAALRSGRNTILFRGRESGTKLDSVLLRRLPDDGSPAADHTPGEVLRNTIENNVLHRLGTVWHGCYGIVNRFASHTRILHNDISDTHYTAIGLDARWNHHGESYSHANEVAYNHLHHLGLRYHSDGGGVYQFGPLDTHIHHNHIHDTRAYPYICGYTGVYLDEQSRGALVEKNLVHDVEWYAYFQHKGVDNTFRNNIGAFARNGFFLRGGLNEQWQTNSCEVWRNIYVAADDVAIQSAWQPGLVPPVLRENMYFSTSVGAGLRFAGRDFASWQAAGQDAGSVLGDPGFRAPLERDFSLNPGAAAITAIGFESFDAEISKAGLYGEAAWTQLPERCVRRRPSAVWTPEDLARTQAFAFDFEDMPDGYEPPLLRLAKEGQATFAVTSGVAASGSKSYRCTDRKGLRKPFYPYIHVAPRNLTRGQIAFAFDAMLHPTQPAPFYAEIRGRGDPPYAVGPSIRVSPEGRITANGIAVLAAEPGTWFGVAVRFALGGDGPATYTLTLQSGNQETSLAIPFTDTAFRDVTWVGIAAETDTDGVFYLDNLSFDIR